VGRCRDRGGLPEPGADEELPDDAFAAPGDAGDLTGAESLLGERAQLLGAGLFRFTWGLWVVLAMAWGAG
jgi:hypothetical protein